MLTLGVTDCLTRLWPCKYLTFGHVDKPFRCIVISVSFSDVFTSVGKRVWRRITKRPKVRSHIYLGVYGIHIHQISIFSPMFDNLLLYKIGGRNRLYDSGGGPSRVQFLRVYGDVGHNLVLPYPSRSTIGGLGDRKVKDSDRS